jgi:murein DD-endopeptidase MepM/ murein hydrolase activator NlpD
VFLNDLTGESGAEIAFDAIRWRQIVTTTPTGPTEPVDPDEPVPPIIDGVHIADGYDSPIGTLAERQAERVWPKGWADASPFARLYFVGTPSEAYHTGADLNWGQPYQDKGLPIYSTASGVVTFAGRLPVWGNVIVIKHDPLRRVDGFVLYSRYGHVQDIMVEAGQRVKRGEQIAEIGDAFGRYVPHLHFDLSATTRLERFPQDWPKTDYNRLIRDYVDPKVFIQTNRP